MSKAKKRPAAAKKPTVKKKSASKKANSVRDFVDRVFNGDNLEMMSGLPNGCCDLIYIDPPFFSNSQRTTSANSRPKNEFSDTWKGGIKSYLAFLQPRLAETHRLLPKSGTLYVHLDYRAAHYVRVLLDTIFGEKNFLNEIIWHYRTGGVARRWFARKHDTILVYAKSIGDHTFNPQRGGEFRTDGLRIDEEGRPYKTTKKGKLYFDPSGPVLSDVWDLPFLSTVSLERTGWPTQKPLTLLDRIINASSNPGDLVADFFCGSGTTLVAAKQSGRKCLGCDVSPDAVAIAKKRLAKFDA